MFIYLCFDRSRKTSLYGWALGLFALGLLSKTVTATLPAALLVIFWWQRGQLVLAARRAAAAAVFCAGPAGRRVHGVGGTHADRSRRRGVRVLAGGSLPDCRPGDLVLLGQARLAGGADVQSIRAGTISQALWWQYLFPAAACCCCWRWLGHLRRRWRGPLAGLLFFVGTLFPVLGFCNVYPFIYSFVADHFQYLASLGVITLASAGMTLLLTRWGLWCRPAGYTVCLLLLATLGTLTWRQSRIYADSDTLYETTLDGNPESWLAHSNLGDLLQGRGRIDQALPHYRKALELMPRYAQLPNNIGFSLAACGRFDEAIALYRRALEIKPDFAEAYNNLGAAMACQGRIDEAMDDYRKALEITPDCAKAHNNFAFALAGLGRFDEAIEHYRKALEIAADKSKAEGNLAVALAARGRINEAIEHGRKALGAKSGEAEVYNYLGVGLAQWGRFDEAMAQYRKALEIEPNHIMALCNLAGTLRRRGRVEEAIFYFHRILEINPDFAQVYRELGLALQSQGRIDEAMTLYRRAIKIKPNDPEAHNCLAWLQATCPETTLRNGAEAIEHAGWADQLCGGRRPDVLNTLAAAYAEAGRFPEALAAAQSLISGHAAKQSGFGRCRAGPHPPVRSRQALSPAVVGFRTGETLTPCIRMSRRLRVLRGAERSNKLEGKNRRPADGVPCPDDTIRRKPTDARTPDAASHVLGGPVGPGAKRLGRRGLSLR